MRFEIFTDQDGLWRWRLRSESGKAIAVCAEGFRTELQCRYNVALAMCANRAEIHHTGLHGTAASATHLGLSR